MSEPIGDVKRIELLVSQIQEAQDVGVVLIASANTGEKKINTFSGTDTLLFFYC